MPSVVVDFVKEKEEGYKRIISRSPLLSSVSTHWNGILAAYDYFLPGQTPEICVKQHGIGIFVDMPKPAEAERLIDGRFRREQVIQGDVVIVPANTWHRTSWNMAGGAIVLGLEPKEFAHIIDETVERDGMELIPHFATPDPLVHQIGLALKRALENSGSASRLYAETLTSSLPRLSAEGRDSQTSRFEFLIPSLSGFSQLPFNLMVVRSYVHSTDGNCVSRSQNISCCIDISIMVCLTLGTIPLTDIQRQRLNDITTVSTAFTAGEPSVNLDKGTPVPLALVIELSHQLTPSSIRNRLSQRVVFHHIFNCQILNHDGLVFTHQLSRQFMEKVFTAISDLTVGTSHFNSRLMPIYRSFFLTTKRFLNTLEFAAMAFKVFGISNLVTVRGSQ